MERASPAHWHLLWRAVELIIRPDVGTFVDADIDKTKLAQVLHYESHFDGEAIIRQGDPGYGFYLIVSGAVNVRIQENDPETG